MINIYLIFNQFSKQYFILFYFTIKKKYFIEIRNFNLWHKTLNSFKILTFISIPFSAFLFIMMHHVYSLLTQILMEGFFARSVKEYSKWRALSLPTMQRVAVGITLYIPGGCLKWLIIILVKSKGDWGGNRGIIVLGLTKRRFS